MSVMPPDRPLLAAAFMICAMAVIGVIDNFIAPLSRHVGLWQFHLMRASIALPMVVVLPLLGLGGLVSFGHAAFFGGGAYAAALIVTYADAPMELALLLAPLGAGMAAVIIGWVCLRLTGVYFAMLTLAFAQLLWSLVFQWGEFTGGDDGLVGIWPCLWF